MGFLLKIPLFMQFHTFLGRFHTFNKHLFLLKFHSARLQTITYLPTEFQAGSFNTLDFYKETDGPTDQPTNRPTDRRTDRRTTRNIEDLVDPKKWFVLQF